MVYTQLEHQVIAAQRMIQVNRHTFTVQRGDACRHSLLPDNASGIMKKTARIKTTRARMDFQTRKEMSVECGWTGDEGQGRFPNTSDFTRCICGTDRFCFLHVPDVLTKVGREGVLLAKNAKFLKMQVVFMLSTTISPSKSQGDRCKPVWTDVLLRLEVSHQCIITINLDKKCGTTLSIQIFSYRM